MGPVLNKFFRASRFADSHVRYHFVVNKQHIWREWAGLGGSWLPPCGLSGLAIRVLFAQSDRPLAIRYNNERIVAWGLRLEDEATGSKHDCHRAFCAAFHRVTLPPRLASFARVRNKLLSFRLSKWSIKLKTLQSRFPVTGVSVER